MINNTPIAIRVPAFEGKDIPEEGIIVGYAALIRHLALPMPAPYSIALISDKNKKYEVEGWKVFTPKHKPEESIYKQLVFALKYEGINLLAFKNLFEKISEVEVLQFLNLEPSGIYSRKIWFLYEWLMRRKLPIRNADVKIKYTLLVNEKTQFAVKGVESARHRIINNLPGTVDFCPLISRTAKLQTQIDANFAAKKSIYLNTIHKSILQRASSFLLLKDSNASFTIEGENPGNNRAIRWGKAIGQAGQKGLSIAELERLQQVVIENSRFIEMGLRKNGGFVGEHDRITGEPIPDHISARETDVLQLMQGLIATNEILQDPKYDAVLAAATIAFGFVFIHPFVDGNGRLHRYIIHHILAKKGLTQQGVIFPISASILDHINDYKAVLELYSHPLLEHIEWHETEDHNVKVTNDTIDLYRYYDATKQAEFLYDCVADTLERVIPEEVNYLQNYDVFKNYIDNRFEMPDKEVALLVRYLEQNKGKLSKKALKTAFSQLNESEVIELEEQFVELFEIE